MENKEQKDNVLFIGNGFDLYNKMKTGYVDYLLSLKVDETFLRNTYKRFCVYKLMYILNDVYLKFDENPKLIKTNKMEKEIIFAKHWGVINESIFGTQRHSGINDIIAKIRIDENFQFKDLKDKEKKVVIFSLLSENNQIRIASNRSGGFEYKYCINGEIKSITRNAHNILKNYLYEEILIEYRSIDDFLLIFDNDFKTVYSAFEIYLMFIRNGQLNKFNNLSELYVGEKWIDIENILYENQFIVFRSRINGITSEYDESFLLTYYEFNKFYNNNKIDMVDDFEKFKMNFIKYINRQQKNLLKSPQKCEKLDCLLKNLFNEFNFNKIYNFNYSNYINEPILKISENIFIDNIHGDIESNENIVFGTNHYLFKKDINVLNEQLNRLGFAILTKNDEKEFKLTKIYQVLKLAQTRNSGETLKKVDSLTIVGHSIGNQDFEYLHTIIQTNPTQIKLNIVWSTWFDKEQVKDVNGKEITKKIKKNNLKGLTEAVYEMLGKYEELYNDITLHRMITENRIKFYHLNDFDK